MKEGTAAGSLPNKERQGLPEQERSKGNQVITPNHPGMHSWRFYHCGIDIFRFQPLDHVPIRRDQAIVGAACDPE